MKTTDVDPMRRRAGGDDGADVAAVLDEIEPLPRFDLEGSEQRADEVLATATALGRQDLIMRAQLVQADVMERRGNLAASGRVARAVNRWATDNDHGYLLARSHYVLEAIFQDMGDHSRALEHAVRAVELLDDAAPARIRFDHLVRLADSVGASGLFESARSRYVEVLRLAEELGDPDRQLVVLNNMAYVEYLAGDFVAALDLSLRVQTVAAVHGITLHAGRLDTVARALIGLGRLEEAEATMLPVLDPEVLRLAPDADAGAECLLTLAEVQRRLGEVDRAERTLERCMTLCRAKNLAGVSTRVLQEQAELQAAKGDFAAAYRTYKTFHDQLMAEQSAQRDVRARTLQAVFETSEAREQSQLYKELSLRDSLTGLYNRRYVDERMPYLLQRCAVDGTSLTVAFVDLDHFKRINDTCSHETGDDVLRAVAGLLDRATTTGGAEKETGSFSARMGGEEFLLVIAGLAPDAALAILEEFRIAVRHGAWTELTKGLPVTVSIGATRNSRVDEDTFAELLSRADHCLYLAKNHGRDQVTTDW